MELQPQYIQNWSEIYKELCQLVCDTMPYIEWQDLWHNQVGFLEEEHPFPTPAIFYAFTITGTQDVSQGVQDVNLQVDIYHYYETFNDTYQGSYNQESALDFLNSVSDLYKQLQGKTGSSYSEMRRVGFRAVDTGSAGNLYVQNYQCKMRDLTAQTGYDGVIPGDVIIDKGETPAQSQQGGYMPTV